MLTLKKKLNYHLTCCVIFALCGGLSNTFAAGIDCSHATTSSESIICGDEKLLKLDTQLAVVYSKLAKAKNSNKTHLQKTQKEWLLVRDKCADESCMIDAYSDRVGKLSLELHSLMAYKVDKIDILALEELRQAVEKIMRSDAEFPLETALKSFEIKDGITDFSNTSEGKDNESPDAHFPTKRPKGVSLDEWAALVKSQINGAGENGHASYTLLDIDGDGKRDLIIDSYIGGTGLFDYISALPRKGNVFEGNYASLLAPDIDSSEEDNSLYSLNGRGANQWATWVKLQGRVYAAYRNSFYAEDNLFLLRPFYINDNTPKLMVRYQYAFSIPRKQSTYNESTGKTVEYTLDTKTHAALIKAIKLVDSTKAHDDGASNKPICPPPENVTEDERSGYFSYGPGHYSYEIVGDMPIWLDKTCHMGRLADWFGSYSKKNGLNTHFWIALPNADKEAVTYDVDGKRKAVKIESGIGKVDFGGS